MTWTNQLYYGDNLRVLREEVKDETVELVHLDPPFNSAANYTESAFASQHGCCGQTRSLSSKE